MSLVGKSTVAALALASMIGAIAAVDGSEDHVKARDLRNAGDILPLEEILRRVRPQAQGRIIEAELYRSDARYHYELELVDDHGAVHELHVDATTGEVIAREREH